MARARSWTRSGRPWPAVDAAYLRVLANDCLASLPPLTFFQDVVLNEAGEQSAMFRLEHSALRPLVDVGRVFGLAAGIGTASIDAAAVRGRAGLWCRSMNRSSAMRRDAAHRALAAGPCRDQPGHRRIRVAAAAAQPLRSSPPEERFPVDSASDRVHRGFHAGSKRVTAPPFLERYRSCFDDDVARRDADRRRALRRARLGDHRARSAHGPDHHDRRRGRDRGRHPC